MCRIPRIPRLAVRENSPNPCRQPASPRTAEKAAGSRTHSRKTNRQQSNGRPGVPDACPRTNQGERTMAATNINRVVLTGNLTADPDLRSLPSGTSVCELRIACNARRKDQSSGEWVDKPNYFNVKVWGAQGENAAKYLSKGRPVAIDGRLDWREWETQAGAKRQAVDIIADSVQFLGSREDSPGGGGPIRDRPAANGASGSDIPVDEGDFQPAPVASGAGDDDIPF